MEKLRLGSILCFVVARSVLPTTRHLFGAGARCRQSGKESVLAHPTVARVDRILASSPIYYGTLFRLALLPAFVTLGDLGVSQAGPSPIDHLHGVHMRLKMSQRCLQGRTTDWRCSTSGRLHGYPLESMSRLGWLQRVCKEHHGTSHYANEVS